MRRLSPEAECFERAREELTELEKGVLLCAAFIQRMFFASEYCVKGIKIFSFNLPETFRACVRQAWRFARLREIFAG